MRGLDKTCTFPCDSRKDKSAAKLAVWKARPNKEPAAFAVAPNAVPAVAVMPVSDAVIVVVLKLVPGETKPKEVRVFGEDLSDANDAQLIPD